MKKKGIPGQFFYLEIMSRRFPRGRRRRRLQRGKNGPEADMGASYMVGSSENETLVGVNTGYLKTTALSCHGSILAKQLETRWGSLHAPRVKN